MEDLRALVRHADDERVARTLDDPFPQPYTLEDGEHFLRHATEDRTRIRLAIDLGGEAIGGIGALPGTGSHRIRAELGYWLGAAFWNRGLMTEAVRGVSDHLLDVHGFQRLEAPVYSINPASARVLEKAGFTRESVQRRAAIKEGRVLDVWLYVRLFGE